MKKRTILPKILLDILLILVLITLYSKNVISLEYHEIAGLAILGLFVIHLVFNRKWFTTMLKKVFSKGLSAKARIISIVDVLLILSWLAVLITSILVSKTIFSFRVFSLNPWHKFTSAAAMILTGIHFGLHWKYFWGFLGKKIHFNRVIALVLTIVIAGFGIYNLATSSFGRWLTAPFSAQGGHGGEGFGRGEGRMSFPQETNADNSEDGNDEDSKPAESADRQSAPSESTENETTERTGREPMGKGEMGGMHGQQAFSFVNLLSVIWTAFSIMFFFSAATYGVEMLLKRRKETPDTAAA